MDFLRRYDTDKKMIDAAPSRHRKVLRWDHEDMFIDNTFLSPDLERGLSQLSGERLKLPEQLPLAGASPRPARVSP
jgi:hypothetical protein